MNFLLGEKASIWELLSSIKIISLEFMNNCYWHFDFLFFQYFYLLMDGNDEYLPIISNL
jgi:hypothetical protein